MLKKFLSSPIATVVLFAVALGLIGYGGIKGIQAAPRIESADYRAQVVLSNIHVVLTENGEIVEGDDTLLQGGFFAANKDKGLNGASDFQVGKTYKEVLAARNAKHPSADKEGEGIDEYVRVTVYKYWVDENGKKRTDLNPEYIKLHLVTDGGWTEDKDASTPERTVLYYKDKLQVDDETDPFADTITISSDVLTQTTNGELDYKNAYFCIKATVDAVQTHNGTEAMISAWGRTNE